MDTVSIPLFFVDDMDFLVDFAIRFGIIDNTFVCKLKNFLTFNPLMFSIIFEACHIHDFS